MFTHGGRNKTGIDVLEFFIASIATTIHWDPNFLELSTTTFEFWTAAVLIDTLSAPQLSN